MASKVKNIQNTDEQGSYLITGWITEINAQGEIFVDFPENPFPSLRSRTLITDFSEFSLNDTLAIPVLLHFDHNNPKSPIIIGIIHDCIDTDARQPLHENPADILPEKTFIDHKEFVISAASQLTLHCGKSSITLKSNGKIIIKGAEVISRASGANKVKGAVININ